MLTELILIDKCPIYLVKGQTSRGPISPANS
jgi:hypothetical protein